jgi:Tfp pilus assembly protein PilO
MINLRDKNQAVPTGILALALVVTLATGVYMLAVPIPTTGPIAAKEQKDAAALKVTAIKAKQNVQDKDKLVANYAFSGRREDAESNTMAEVTKLTLQRKVKLLGFRPQRGIDAGALTQLPFLVSVSGKFTDVLGFTHDLEANGSKLSVNNVQLAASDPSTDDVTANINVVGYLNQPLGNGGQNG